MAIVAHGNLSSPQALLQDETNMCFHWVFLKSKISHGAQSNQNIKAFLKSKISYGAQSNQKIEDFLKSNWNQRFMAHRVIKKLKYFLKSKISYGAQSNKKLKRFLKSKIS